jgi:hypothetical protein
MSLAPIREFPTPGDAVPSGFVRLPNAILTDAVLPAARPICPAPLTREVH